MANRLKKDSESAAASIDDTDNLLFAPQKFSSSDDIARYQEALQKKTATFFPAGAGTPKGFKNSVQKEGFSKESYYRDAFNKFTKKSLVQPPEEKILAIAYAIINALDIWLFTPFRNDDYFTDHSNHNHTAFSSDSFQNFYYHNIFHLLLTAGFGIGFITIYFVMKYINDSRAERYTSNGLVTTTMDRERKELLEKKMLRLIKNIELLKQAQLQTEELPAGQARAEDDKNIYLTVEEVAAIRNENIAIMKDPLVARLFIRFEQEALQQESNSNIPDHKIVSNIQEYHLRVIDEELKDQTEEDIQATFNELKTLKPKLFANKELNINFYYGKRSNGEGKEKARVDYEIKFAEGADDRISMEEARKEIKKDDNKDTRGTFYKSIGLFYPMCYWILWFSAKIANAFTGGYFSGFNYFSFVLLGVAAIPTLLYFGVKIVNHALSKKPAALEGSSEDLSEEEKEKLHPDYDPSVKRRLTSDEKKELAKAKHYLSQYYGVKKQLERAKATLEHSRLKLSMKLDKLTRGQFSLKDRQKLFNNAEINQRQWVAANIDYINWILLKNRLATWDKNNNKVTLEPDVMVQNIIDRLFENRILVKNEKLFNQEFINWTNRGSLRPFDEKPDEISLERFLPHSCNPETQVLPEFVKRLGYYAEGWRHSVKVGGAVLYTGVTNFMIFSFMLWPWQDLAAASFHFFTLNWVQALFSVASWGIAVGLAVYYGRNEYKELNKSFEDQKERIKELKASGQLTEFALRQQEVLRLRDEIERKSGILAKKQETINRKLKAMGKSEAELLKFKYTSSQINSALHDDDYAFGSANSKDAGKTRWKLLKRIFKRIEAFIGTAGSFFFMTRASFDMVLGILTLIALGAAVAVAPHVALAVFIIGAVSCGIGGLGKALLGYHCVQERKRDAEMLDNFEIRFETLKQEHELLQLHDETLDVEIKAIETASKFIEADFKAHQASQVQNGVFNKLWAAFGSNKASADNENKPVSSATDNLPVPAPG